VKESQNASGFSCDLHPENLPAHACTALVSILGRTRDRSKSEAGDGQVKGYIFYVTESVCNDAKSDDYALDLRESQKK
jgi:hypothetical protein